MRGAFPLCLGIALGAGALSAALLVVAGLGDDAAPWRSGGGLIGAALLGWVAVSVARQRPPGEEARPPRRAGLAAFGAGFCTAATNPLTAAFFAAQFLGPPTGDAAVLALVPVCAAATALAFFLGAAALLAHPACRAAVVAWHGPIRAAACAALAVVAAASATRALQAAGLAFPGAL